jgi:hypothetical protein
VRTALHLSLARQLPSHAHNSFRALSCKVLLAGRGLRRFSFDFGIKFLALHYDSTRLRLLTRVFTRFSMRVEQHGLPVLISSGARTVLDSSSYSPPSATLPASPSAKVTRLSGVLSL